MKDIKLDKYKHDLKIEGFDLALVDQDERIMQQIKIRVQFFFQEWFLNIGKGIPYYQEVVRKGGDISRIEAIFKEQILSTPNVLELLAFSMDFDAKLRKLYINFKIRTDFGVIENREGVVI